VAVSERVVEDFAQSDCPTLVKSRVQSDILSAVNGEGLRPSGNRASPDDGGASLRGNTSNHKERPKNALCVVLRQPSQSGYENTPVRRAAIPKTVT